MRSRRQARDRGVPRALRRRAATRACGRHRLRRARKASGPSSSMSEVWNRRRAALPHSEQVGKNRRDLRASSLPLPRLLPPVLRCRPSGIGVRREGRNVGTSMAGFTALPRRCAMISVKLTIALSMIGVAASTFGIGSYVSRSRAPVESSQDEEIEVARLPVQPGFEFAPAASVGATRPAEAKVLLLEPVLIYGRGFASRGPKSDTDRD